MDLSEIDFNSPDWMKLRRYLRERRDDLIEELIAPGTEHDRSNTLRGAIQELDTMLDADTKNP